MPRDVETICLKCLAKEPSRRYPSAEALADDLGFWLVGQPIRARPLSGGERLWRWSLRNRMVAGLLAAIFLLLIGGTAGMTVLWARARAEVGRLSVGLTLDRGLALAETGDVARGLHFMAEALRIDPTGDAGMGRVARANLADWAEQVPRPVEQLGFLSPAAGSGVAPDGRRGFVTVGDTSIQLIDLATLRPVATLDHRHRSRITRAVYRPDGPILATLDLVGGIQLWDTSTGQPPGADPRPPDSGHRGRLPPPRQPLADHDRQGTPALGPPDESSRDWAVADRRLSPGGGVQSRWIGPGHKHHE